MKIQHAVTQQTRDVVAVERPRVPGRPTAGQPGADARPAATVDLSIRSRELHAALRAADGLPDVRADVVREIRDRIDAGTYRLDPEAIARRMLDVQA